MKFEVEELAETLRMVRAEHLDVRAATLGLSVQDCAGQNAEEIIPRLQGKLRRFGGKLVETVRQVSREYGVPVANSRLALTPMAELVANLSAPEQLAIARALDETAAELGIDFLGGWSALVHKGHSEAEEAFLLNLRGAGEYSARVRERQRGQFQKWYKPGRGGPVRRGHQAHGRADRRAGRAGLRQVRRFRQRARG